MVGGDLLAAGTRRIDLGDDGGGLSLHVDAQRLDVADMRGQPALAADADRFVDRGGEANGVAALVADMAVIAAAALAGFLGQLDHFLGLGEALGSVEQTRGEAERAVAHGVGDEALHPVQLGRRGIAGILAHHHLAHRLETDPGGIVDAHRLRSRAAENLGQPRLPPPSLPMNAVVTPCIRKAGNQPLSGIARSEIVAHMRIDETGRDDHGPWHRSRARGEHRRMPAHRDDAVALDRDVTDERRIRPGVIVPPRITTSTFCGGGGAAAPSETAAIPSSSAIFMAFPRIPEVADGASRPVLDPTGAVLGEPDGAVKVDEIGYAGDVQPPRSTGRS